MNTPRFGLIGDPIGTSLSPALFRAAYGGTLDYDLIEGADFEQSWQRFLDDYQAINVTAPFKEAAFARTVALAREGKGTVSGPCLKIGATNMLVKGENGIEAHNFDFTGILMSVAETLFPGIVQEFIGTYATRAHIKVHQFCREALPKIYPEKPQALIVGTGGAGKAAAVAAAELGYATVLMNRTPDKAAAFSARLPEYGFLVDPMEDFIPAVKECDLVVYTVPAAVPALEKLSADDFAGEKRPGQPAKIILDANYRIPVFNAQIRQRLSEGKARYIPGTEWLLYQAVSGYGTMTGRPCDVKAMASFFK